MEKGIWLVTTEHLANRLWFKDEMDYKAGMNIVAALSATLPARVLAFILMSNHVHFILQGFHPGADTFIQGLKRRYSQYYAHKYGIRELLRENSVNFQQLAIGDESFERAVAYVHMNSVAANICLSAESYPWGTGGCFFRTAPCLETPLSVFSQREIIRITHCKVHFPGSWRMDSRGFIAPASYVPVEYVESVFRTPRRMGYFLKSSSKAQRGAETPSFSDAVVGSGLRDLCISLFRRNGMDELDETGKAHLLQQLRYRFSSDPNQIARVSGLTYEEVARLLDRY